MKNGTGGELYRCIKIRNYHRQYNKIKPKTKEYVLSEQKFGKILTSLTKKLFDYLIENSHYTIPEKLGWLYFRKIEVKPEMKNGKLQYIAPVDWGATNKLWASDEEAKRNKQLVKVAPGNIYCIKYVPGSKRNQLTHYKFLLIENLKVNRLKNLTEKEKEKAMIYWFPVVINKRINNHGIY